MRPVLTVGSVAFDSIKTPCGEVSRIVGGAATFFSVVASFFTHVRLVGVVGVYFGEPEMRCLAAGESIWPACNAFLERRFDGRGNTGRTLIVGRQFIRT